MWFVGQLETKKQEGKYRWKENGKDRAWEDKDQKKERDLNVENKAEGGGGEDRNIVLS